MARDGWFLIDTELPDASSEPIHLLLNWKPPGKQKAAASDPSPESDSRQGCP